LCEDGVDIIRLNNIYGSKLDNYNNIVFVTKKVVQ